MRRKELTLFVTVISTLACSQAYAQDVFNYGITWKWGIINEEAGEVTISIDDQGGNFSGTLAGHSIPWEGRVYCINDTLNAHMTINSEDVDYLDGWYRKPKIHGDSNENSPSQYRTIDEQGDLSASNTTMEAVAITADMLGLYHYAKVIDFEAMSPGDILSIPIYNNNGEPGELQVKYCGKSQNGAYGDVYNIIFNYTYQGQLSSYPANSSISVENRVPVTISADIRIGHVEMELRE